MRVFYLCFYFIEFFHQSEREKTFNTFEAIYDKFYYYNPISFVTKRNRVVPEKKSFNPLPARSRERLPLEIKGE